MSQYLPPRLLELFKANDPLEFRRPLQPLPHERKYRGPMTGVAEYLSLFEDPKDTPPATRGETKAERDARKKAEREARSKALLESREAAWDPKSREGVTADPYKTLFVARINHETTEDTLRREFEEYGPIKEIHMINDTQTGKPRGYAFIEYEHERDMHAAYKRADGRKINGRRVVVDVERARTVDGWKPRSLGGGLGGSRSRAGEASENKYSGRETSDRGGSSYGGGGSSYGGGSYRESGGSYRESGSSYRDRDRDREGSSYGGGGSSYRSSSYRGSSRYDERGDDDRERRSSRRYDDREKDRDRGRSRERGRSRDRDERDRDRDRDRDGEKSRDRERSRERDRDRERSRDRDDRERRSSRHDDMDVSDDRDKDRSDRDRERDHDRAERSDRERTPQRDRDDRD